MARLFARRAAVVSPCKTSKLVSFLEATKTILQEESLISAEATTNVSLIATSKVPLRLQSLGGTQREDK